MRCVHRTCTCTDGRTDGGNGQQHKQHKQVGVRKFGQPPVLSAAGRKSHSGVTFVLVAPFSFLFFLFFCCTQFFGEISLILRLLLLAENCCVDRLAKKIRRIPKGGGGGGGRRRRRKENHWKLG